MQDLDQTTNSTVLEISEKEVSRMAGRKKFLGDDFKKVSIKLKNEQIELIERIVKIDSKANTSLIVRNALDSYFSSLPELRKQKRAS
jgi:hypothetical protein